MKKVFIALVLFAVSANAGICEVLQSEYEKTFVSEQISDKLKYLKADYKNYLNGKTSLIGKFKADYEYINPERKPTKEPNAWTLVKINTRLADSVKSNKQPKYLNVPNSDFKYLTDVVKKDLCLYNNYFTEIPKHNLAQHEFSITVRKAESKFLSIAKQGEKSDIAFEQLLNKYKTAIDNLNANTTEEIDENDSYYKNNWVKLHMTEGWNYYTLNYNYLQKKYGKYLSQECNIWLKHLAKSEYFFQDAGLSIPVDELRKNIIKLENFREKYCNFAYLYKVQDELDLYVNIYLMGTDNTPVFDKWNTLAMSSEYKASYEKFLKQNKNSYYYAAVEALYTKSKDKNFKWDKDFDAWYYNDFYQKYIAD